jgi:hypothetical protein
MTRVINLNPAMARTGRSGVKPLLNIDPLLSGTRPEAEAA